MRTKVYVFLALFVIIGCGKKQLQNQVIELKEELTSCEYKIDESKQEERELRMEAMPEEADRPPSPAFVAPWYRSFTEIAEDIHKEMDGEPYTLASREGVLVVTMLTAHFFDAGSKKLSADGKDTMDTILGVFKDQGRRKLGVAVRSHELKTPKGESASSAEVVNANRSLSTTRALAIAAYLEEGGVDPIQLTAIGYAVNPDNEDLAVESAIEFIIHPRGDEIPKYPEVK